VTFTVQPADVDEDQIKEAEAGNDPAGIALKLALAKAEKISATHADCLVLGADQILECDNQLFDKPADRAGAAQHLKKMRGRTHRLITAAAIVLNGAELWSLTTEARLTMRQFSDDFLEQYLEQAGDDVLASVGAYRLEDAGAQLFSKIEGDYFTILGLPLLQLLEYLRSHGVMAE